MSQIVSFQEHQELLQNVVEHEKKLMKKEAHILRVTTGMFRKVTRQEKEVSGIYANI